MTTIHLQQFVHVSTFTQEIDEFLLAEFSATHTEVLAVAPEGIPVGVGVGARAGPIHPIGVRLDLNLAILTATESQ